MLRTLLCVLCASAVTLSARADDGWSLTTADFKRQTVSLKAIDDEKGATVVPFGAEASTVVPWDKVLQFDRGGRDVQQVRGTFTLHLVTGDRVGGEPAAIANDNVIWKSPAAGELTIPLKDCRGIVRGGDATPPPADPQRTTDLVLLSNGDTVTGIVTAMENGKLQVKQTTGDVLPVDLSAAKAVHFAAAAATTAGGRAFRVQLSDGSVVTAPKLKLSDGKLTLTFGPGNDRPIDVATVSLIEQLNGPVAWLSARPPAEIVYQPMFETHFPPQMDRTYKGGAERIRFSGREYARGIGVHAYAKLTWNVEGQGFAAFRTQYALAEDASKGRVTVRVLLDDKVVHEAKDFPPAKLSPVILIDVGSAKTISLEAHPGGDPASPDPIKWNADTHARLNWIEPALLKEKPQAEAAPKVESTPNAEPAKPEGKPESGDGAK